METIVLIKQVPDTTDVKLDPKTGNLIREGLDSIINPEDLLAIEEAVRIKETHGGRITVLSMGPSQAVDAVTEALGMGADRGILLCDPNFAGADTWATSFTLGKAIEKIQKFDLILCGRQAIDGDTAQVGPQVAEYIGLPQITYVTEIEELTEKHIIVKKMLENGYQRIQASLPALITVTGNLNNVRYPHLARLIKSCAEKAPIDIWNAADIGASVDQIGLKGSLTQVIKTFAPKVKRDLEIIEGTKEEAVFSLIDKLKQKKDLKVSSII